MTPPKDFFGREFEAGQKVIKAYGRSNWLTERTVAKIANGKVYLDGINLVPLIYPENVMIITEAMVSV